MHFPRFPVQKWGYGLGTGEGGGATSTLSCDGPHSVKQAVVADIIVAAIILFPAAALAIHTVPREHFARASLTWALMSIEREE
jgi:hypothetical protein